MCVCVCMCVFHIFFIHSSVDGHLSCFCILAIVNNAAAIIGVRTPFQISVFVFLGYSEMELLDRRVVLFLIFEEPLHCFP